MKDVWKMTKPQLQDEAGQHFKVLNLYRAFGGPVSKAEWEREVLELRDEVAAKENRCECGHHTNHHSQQGCDFDGCTCAQHKPVGSEVPTVTARPPIDRAMTRDDQIRIWTALGVHAANLESDAKAGVYDGEWAKVEAAEVRELQDNLEAKWGIDR